MLVRRMLSELFRQLLFPFADLRATRNTIFFQKKTIEKLRNQVRLSSALGRQDELLRAVADGKCLVEAAVEYVRLVKPENRILARSFIQSLTQNAKTASAGYLAFAVMLSKQGLFESAYRYFCLGGSQEARRLATYEYFDSMLSVDQVSGLNEITEHLRKGGLPVQTRFDIILVLAKFRALELLREEVKSLRADESSLSMLSLEDRDLLEWLVKRLTSENLKVTASPEVINIAVMDYKLLDKSKTSRNKGDYVQTLASLSNLLRFQNIEFVGDTNLSKYLSALKREVRVDRRIECPPIKVRPVALDRDFASGREYPEDTWLISNGWFMHRSFKGPVDFPYPVNVKPIMISFHLNDIDVLSEQVVTELRRLQPIGCRDFTTVYRLRDHNIKAFFSGCVTTTVGQILPKASGTRQKKLAHVEGKLEASNYRGWKVDQFTQFSEQVRDFDLVEGIEDSRQMLARYTKYREISTSRLHCYLPARSMGLTVNFRPSNLADVRFEGLINLEDASFQDMRRGIEGKLETILKAILEGRCEDEVRKFWSEICEPDVRLAEEYASSYSSPSETKINVQQALSTVQEASCRIGENPRGDDVVNVAFALDKNLQAVIPTVIQSLLDNTQRAVDIHVLTRELGGDFRDNLGMTFPEINFFFYAVDEINYGQSIKLLAHTSVSTLDRLFLPEILSHLNKVLYLDLDVLIDADVGELYDLDLGEDMFAGKRTALKSWSSMLRPITRASLQMQAGDAWIFRRRMHNEFNLTAPTFNAGVLLLNLKLMRDENFSRSSLYLVENHRLNDQDVLNLFSRGRVLEIEADWNHVPSQDFSDGPKIIHWAGPVKPWGRDYILAKQLFEATALRVKARIDS